MLALTATASKRKRRRIINSLNMKGCAEYVDSPDRRNIKLSKHIIKSTAPLEETFAWLLHLLLSHECPRLLIFCKTINDCSKMYFFCKENLTSNLLKHVDMFHSQTPEKTKKRIQEDMADQDGHILVLICSNAACMGVNFVGVNLVVNYGPPQEMDTLIQQIGRAGRNGEQAYHVLIYNNKQLRNLDPDVLQYVRNEENICLRQIILSHYSTVCDINRVMHKCCQICDKTCDCGTAECFMFVSVVDRAISLKNVEEDENIDNEDDEIPLHTKQCLKNCLQEYRRQLNDKSEASFTAVPELTHGFDQQVVQDIVNKCSILKCPDDVISNCSVWTYGQAKIVYEIVCSVLGYENEEHNVSEDENDQTVLYIDADDGGNMLIDEI